MAAGGATLATVPLARDNTKIRPPDIVIEEPGENKLARIFH